MILWITALCYISPFFIPKLWPLALFFPPLLLESLATSSRSLLMWSFATTVILMAPLSCALIEMAKGSWLLKLTPPALLTAYVAMWPAAWLLLSRWAFQKIPTRSLKCIAWTILLWFYFLFMETAFLWPLGRCEGYLLFNPLLPLSYNPPLLGPLSVFPLWFVLLWYSIITSSLYAAFYKKKALFITLFFTVPWFFMASNRSQLAPPSWLKKVGHLPMMLPSSLSLEHGCSLINYEIEKIRNIHPSISTIIMPESSWSGSALTPQKKLLFNIKHLCIGSYAERYGQYLNTLYHFHEGLLEHRCEKRHAIPLVERNLLGTHFFCNSLYFSETPATTPSRQPRKSIYLDEIGRFVPYICSELYCNSQPDDQLTQPILALCNDWWFPASFKMLMALGARFRAVQWGRPILYISFHYALYFDRLGDTHPIGTTYPNALLRNSKGF